MKFLKGIILCTALLALTACGSKKEAPAPVSSENQPVTSETTSESESAPATVVEIQSVKMDYSSFEMYEFPEIPYVYLGKQYLVKLFAYGEDTETPLESDQIEYRLTGNDGTTVLSYIKVEQGDKPNEFYLTATSQGTGIGKFDLHGMAKLKKDKVWSSAPFVNSIDIVVPEA